MTDKTEQDYLRAIGRIKSGQVTHPDLVKLAACGKLKLNITAVAKESGRSRTAIATEASPYPNVRNAILLGDGAKQSGMQDRPRTTGANVQFHLLQSRKHIRAKEHVIQVLGTQLVDAKKQILDLKLKLDRAEERLARLSLDRHPA